jgi:hypothetical protein
MARRVKSHPELEVEDSNDWSKLQELCTGPNFDTNRCSGPIVSNTRMAGTPDAVVVARIVQSALGLHATDVRRFPTGGSRYVFECLHPGGAVVARLGRVGEPLHSAVGWHRRLEEVGVQIPKLLAHGDEPFPHLLLTRLPGSDLGDVVGSLSKNELAAIAAGVADAQRRVATLPPLAGYGYAQSYDDVTLAPSWSGVLDRLLERTRDRVTETRAFDPTLIDLVATAIERRRPELDGIAPTPFLDDTTTRNVIVHEGALSGIVDYDYVGSGDRRFVAALTKVALVAHGHATTYAAFLLDALGGDGDGLMPLYESLFCVDLLSEAGLAFNRDEPEPPDPARHARLEALLRDRLDA